eukprot:CAMPEP_0182831360 /NCGR_PEP_ID=MMETSP0006_2-20121128/19086_1 /TAXON_ID=97485 /ORGANISM="Prymnesium parvum, Strain Texoma1" /LENGTH=102 /DNA_ID=CAMNT_0024959027 /DNA_START=534 /DNA_END=843 /DNA_ORIENTATION=-
MASVGASAIASGRMAGASISTGVATEGGQWVLEAVERLVGVPPRRPRTGLGGARSRRGWVALAVWRCGPSAAGFGRHIRLRVAPRMAGCLPLLRAGGILPGS